MKSGVTSASAMRSRWASTTTGHRQRTPAAVSDIDTLSAAAGAEHELGLGLIVAIGTQNAFFLRQGLRREQVGPVVALCARCGADDRRRGRRGPAAGDLAGAGVVIGGRWRGFPARLQPAPAGDEAGAGLVQLTWLTAPEREGPPTGAALTPQ